MVTLVLGDDEVRDLARKNYMFRKIRESRGREGGMVGKGKTSHGIESYGASVNFSSADKYRLSCNAVVMEGVLCTLVKTEPNKRRERRL
jgi:hypothetical protein